MDFYKSPSPAQCLLCLCLLVGLSGCGKPLPTVSDLNPVKVHKIDIAQGNIVNQNMLASLRQGMDQRQVNFMLGTPMVIDPFDSQRWNYIYSLEKGGEQRQQRAISLYFDDENKLARIDGDVVMQLRPMGEEITATKQTVNVPARIIKEPGLLGRLTGMVGLPEDSFVSEEEQAKEEKPGIWSKVGGALGFGGDDEVSAETHAPQEKQPESVTSLKEANPPGGDFRPVQPKESVADSDQGATDVEPSAEKTPVLDEDAGLFDGLLRGISH